MQLIGGSSFLTRPMEPGCDTRCEYQRCCGTRLEPQRPIDPLRAVKIRRLYCDESTEDGGREPASAPGNERSHESTREGAQRCEHGREDQHRRFALPHTTSLLRGRLLSTPGATGASTTVRRNEYVLRQVVSCWLLPSRNRQLASRVAAQDAIGNLTCPLKRPCSPCRLQRVVRLRQRATELLTFALKATDDCSPRPKTSLLSRSHARQA